MLNRGTVKIVSGVDQVQTDNAVPYHRAADTVDESISTIGVQHDVDRRAARFR
jgi:hypothetical protein